MALLEPCVKWKRIVFIFCQFSLNNFRFAFDEMTMSLDGGWDKKLIDFSAS